MLVIGGVVGWKCLPEAALISVIVSYTFSQNQNEDKLNQKIMMCYFRFLLWIDLPVAMIMFCTKYLISQ
jgi:hypothetical protein